MKIGFYLETHLPGGVERMLLDLIDLCDTTDEVVVLHNCEPRFESFLKANVSRPVRNVPIPIRQTHALRTLLEKRPVILRKPLIGALRACEYVLFFEWTVRQLQRVLGAERLEVLQVVAGGYPGALSGLSAMTAARRSGVRKIYVNVMSQPWPRQYPILDRLLDARLAKAVTIWLPNTQLACERLVQLRHMPEERVRRLYAWTKSSSNPLPVRSPKPSIHVGTACVLIAGKGVVHLIRAVDEVRAAGIGVTLSIAGDGPERGTLEAEVGLRHLADRVHFLGHLDSDGITRFLDTLDIFVFASVIPTEGLPYVILEAMSRRLPVIFTNVGGAGEATVDGISGLRVPPGHPGAIAQAIKRLATNVDLQRQLADNAYQRWSTLFSESVARPLVRALYQAG
jgi:glycosyltransferase involved in cell wall biosynthesis